MNFKEYLIIHNCTPFHKDELRLYKEQKVPLEYCQEAKKLYNNYKNIVLFALFFSALLGFGSAVALLSYSGKEPVNISYVLFFTFLMPLILALFTLFSLFTRSFNFAPFGLVAKALSKLFKKEITIKIDTELEKYVMIKNSLLMQLSFAFGFLFAFIIMLLFTDVAFAWSSTIITPEQFSTLIHTIALPWSYFKEAIPSLETITNSQFFQLDKLEHFDAKMLASWWSFLLLSIVVYMIILRLLLLALVEFFYRKALKKAIVRSFAIEEWKSIVEAKDIAIESSKESNSVTKVEKKSTLANKKKQAFQAVFAWNYTLSEVQELLEKLAINKEPLIVGGLNSFEEDATLLKEATHKEVLLIVKSWDVPTLDFIDFLEELSKEAKSVALYFQILNEKSYQDIAIWKDKIESFAFDNITIVGA